MDTTQCVISVPRFLSGPPCNSCSQKLRLKLNCQCCSEREGGHYVTCKGCSVLRVQECTCLPHLQPRGPSLHLKKWCCLHFSGLKFRKFITERSPSCPVIQMCLATAANTAKNRKHQRIEKIIGSFYVFLFCPREIGKGQFGSSQHKAVIFCQDSLVCCACPHGAQLDRGKRTQLQGNTKGQAMSTTHLLPRSLSAASVLAASHATCSNSTAPA